MASEIQLRPGVVFRESSSGNGSMHLPGNRHVDQVCFKGTIEGRTDDGKSAVVNVFSAVYPTSQEKIASKEHMPAIAVVAVETHYLHSESAFLSSLFSLPLFVESGGDLDPLRTLVLTMHGSVEVHGVDQIRPGSPSLRSVNPTRWIYLEPSAMATLVGWIRSPEGQVPNAVINTGCFSSTRDGQKGASFNEELAALLAELGDIALLGPPHAGIVTTATQFGQWRNLFTQSQEDATRIPDVPIRFHRIAPVTVFLSRNERRRKKTQRPARHESEISGSVIATNDYALASTLASFSTDFAESKEH